MLCWLLCGLSCCSLLGGLSRCWRGGLSRCWRDGPPRWWRDGPPRWWRDGVALLLNDRRFRVRNGGRRLHRRSSGRCAPDRGLVVLLRQQLIDVQSTMLCWLLCGLSCCWRGDLLRYFNDRCLRGRNRPRWFCRFNGARCTRNRGLVVVFRPFLDRTRIVLTHHREKRVGFLLGFDDT